MMVIGHAVATDGSFLFLPALPLLLLPITPSVQERVCFRAARKYSNAVFTKSSNTLLSIAAVRNYEMTAKSSDTGWDDW
jgi:hypothetical protein